MSHTLTRRLLLAQALAVFAAPSLAARTPYRLEPDGSTIAFIFNLGGVAQTGTAPVARADLRVDPQDLAASTADVSADISRARTGLIFATDALKSAQVLDAARHPTARFVSTRVRLGRDGRISAGARLEGRLTLRGVTRPITFDATLTRPRGTAPDDLSRLTIQLTGAVDRRDFGANGYPELVAPRVGLDITAQIRAAG